MDPKDGIIAWPEVSLQTFHAVAALRIVVLPTDFTVNGDSRIGIYASRRCDFLRIAGMFLTN
jgi:hypothetical protein